MIPLRSVASRDSQKGGWTSLQASKGPQNNASSRGAIRFGSNQIKWMERGMDIGMSKGMDRGMEGGGWEGRMGGG